jgi:hypothetical protein
VPCVGPGDIGEDCCGRPVARGGLCWGHLKVRERGGALRPLKSKPSPFERVIEAGSAFLEAEAEDDDEYRRTLAAFRRAAEGWMRAEGWSPPPAPERQDERAPEPARLVAQAACSACAGAQPAGA